MRYESLSTRPMFPVSAISDSWSSQASTSASSVLAQLADVAIAPCVPAPRGCEPRARSGFLPASHSVRASVKWILAATSRSRGGRQETLGLLGQRQRFLWRAPSSRRSSAVAASRAGKLGSQRFLSHRSEPGLMHGCARLQSDFGDTGTSPTRRWLSALTRRRSLPAHRFEGLTREGQQSNCPA